MRRCLLSVVGEGRRRAVHIEEAAAASAAWPVPPEARRRIGERPWTARRRKWNVGAGLISRETRRQDRLLLLLLLLLLFSFLRQRPPRRRRQQRMRRRTWRAPPAPSTGPGTFRAPETRPGCRGGAPGVESRVGWVAWVDGMRDASNHGSHKLYLDGGLELQAQANQFLPPRLLVVCLLLVVLVHREDRGALCGGWVKCGKGRGGGKAGGERRRNLAKAPPQSSFMVYDSRPSTPTPTHHTHSSHAHVSPAARGDEGGGQGGRRSEARDPVGSRME